jgi:hypothetical protein
MNNVIGKCSICGGDVVGFTGIWMAVIPPPPAQCTSCGAVEAGTVIKMTPAPTHPMSQLSRISTSNSTGPANPLIGAKAKEATQ